MSSNYSPARAVVVCDQWLGSNGYAGMKALRRAGWSAQVVPEREFVPVRWQSRKMRILARTLRSGCVAEFNSALLRAVRLTRPTMLLVFKGTFVRAEALAEIRAAGVRAYCFYPDVSVFAHGPYLPIALQQYDWIYTTKTFGLADMRRHLAIEHASVMQHAFDADLHRPIELGPDDLERYSCDVSFIGTWSPKKERLLAHLVRALPNTRIRIWGEQWYKRSDRSLDRAIAGHEVTGDDYVRAIRGSRINLCILSERRDGASSGDQVTSRTFHIPACGGFMLHERTTELLELFAEGESVGAFGDGDELVSSVGRWLGDSVHRERVAQCGMEMVRRAHSWDDRIAVILARNAASL
jgi:spore maturation protein CgeB